MKAKLKKSGKKKVKRKETRVTIDLDLSDSNRLSDLQYKFGLETKSAALRQSLRVLHYFCDKTHNGHKVYVGEDKSSATERILTVFS